MPRVRETRRIFHDAYFCIEPENKISFVYQQKEALLTSILEDPGWKNIIKDQFYSVKTSKEDIGIKIPLEKLLEAKLKVDEKGRIFRTEKDSKLSRIVKSIVIYSIGIFGSAGLGYLVGNYISGGSEYWNKQIPPVFACFEAMVGAFLSKGVYDESEGEYKKIKKILKKIK